MSATNNQSNKPQPKQNANKPHKKPAATISKEDKKILWNELAIYCSSLLEEAKTSEHKPGHKFNHSESKIEIFVKLGLRAPNNYKGLSKFYDNFIKRCNFVPSNRPKPMKNKKKKKKKHQASRSVGFGQRVSNNGPRGYGRGGGHGYVQSHDYGRNKQQLRDNLPAPKAPNMRQYGNNNNNNMNMPFHQQQQQQQQQQMGQPQFQQYGVVNVTHNLNQMNYVSSIGQLNNMNMSNMNPNNVSMNNFNMNGQQMNNVPRNHQQQQQQMNNMNGMNRSYMNKQQQMNQPRMNQPQMNGMNVSNHQQMNSMKQMNTLVNINNNNMAQQPQQQPLQMCQNGQILATIQIPVNTQMSAQEVFAVYQQQVMQMQQQQQQQQQMSQQQQQVSPQQQMLYNSANGQVLFPSNQLQNYQTSQFNNSQTAIRSASPQFPSMFSSQNQGNNNIHHSAHNSSNSQYAASHKNTRSMQSHSHSTNQESLTLSNHPSGHSMSMSMRSAQNDNNGVMAPVLSDDYSGHTDNSQHSKNSEIIPKGLPHKASKRYSSNSKHLQSQSLNIDNDAMNNQSMHIQSNSYSPYPSVANSSSSVSTMSNTASPYRAIAIPQSFGLQTVPETNDNLNNMIPFIQHPTTKVTAHSVQSSNASSYLSNIGHNPQLSSISDASSLNAPSPDVALPPIENTQNREQHQRTATPINKRLNILGNNRRLNNNSFDIATNNMIRSQLLDVQNGLFSIQSNQSGWSVNSASNVSTKSNDFFTLGFINTDGKYVRFLFEYLQKEVDDLALFLDLNAVPSRTASIASNSLRPFGGSLSAKSSRNISNQSSFNPFVGALSNKLSLGRTLIPNLSNLSNTSSYKPFGYNLSNLSANSLNDKRSNTLSLKPLHQSDESVQVDAMPTIPSSGPSHAVADSTDYETIKDMVYVHPISDSIDVGNLAICKEVGIEVPKMNIDAITESESESTTKDSLVSAESNKPHQPKGSVLLSPVASVNTFVGSIHGSIAAPHNDLDGLVIFEPVKPFEILDLYRMRNKDAPFLQFKNQFEGILHAAFNGCVKYLNHRIKHTMSYIKFVRFVVYAMPKPSSDVSSIWYELCEMRQDYVCRAIEECNNLIFECKTEMTFSACIVPINPNSFDDVKECVVEKKNYYLSNYERTKSSLPFTTKSQLAVKLSNDIKNSKKSSEANSKSTST